MRSASTASWVGRVAICTTPSIPTEINRREHKVSSEAFIEIGGDYIRVDAITRLFTTDVVGSPGVSQHFARLSDGASIPLSEKDYSDLRRRFFSEPRKKLRKTGA